MLLMAVVAVVVEGRGGKIGMVKCGKDCGKTVANMKKGMKKNVFRLVPGSTLDSNSLILFTNPSVRAGYDTRLVFKRSLAGLNSEFSFS